MKIKEIGGEFALIERLCRGISQKNVVVGIGDDCAVLDFDEQYYLLVTTDMLVEKDHFRLEWYTPYQIGKKAMEANVSDIAAMGGFPETSFIAVSLTDNIEVEFMDELYNGMKKVCDRFDFVIAGGDTTHGSVLTLAITMIGKVEKVKLCLRSHARVGDLICVSGDLGKSWAGLELLLNEIKPNNPLLKKALLEHLEPTCRMDIARDLAPHVNAMIDVSDGLASEVNHICERSGTGAVVYKERIPLSASTKEVAKVLGKDPYHWALNGGEDFELLFTVPEKGLDKIKHLSPVVVGKIKEKEEGTYLLDEKGKKMRLKGGYDHFEATSFYSN